MTRCRPGQNFLDLRAVGSDTIPGDAVAEEGEVDAEEVGLLERTVELVFPQRIENRLGIVTMFTAKNVSFSAKQYLQETDKNELTPESSRE